MQMSFNLKVFFFMKFYKIISYPFLLALNNKTKLKVYFQLVIGLSIKIASIITE
jgi:hypothetical protein